MKWLAAFILFFSLITIAQPEQKYLKQANQKLDSGKSREAEPLYTAALDINPNLEEALLKRGIARSRINNIQGAKTDLKMVLSLNPKSARAYEELARIDKNSAIADLDHWIALEPKNIIAYQRRAAAKYQNKDYLGAIADNDTVISLDRKSASAYAFRAQTKGDMKDYDGAISDYKMAASLEKRFPWIYYNDIGIMELGMKNYKDAIEYYSKAIGLKPEPGFYSNRGLVRILIGDYRNAVEDFTAAMNGPEGFNKYISDMSQARNYKNRADAKKLGGDYKGAIADYDEALNLNTTYKEALAERGGAKYHEGDKTGACDDWSKASGLGYKQAADKLAQFCK